jgi:hypothetical protein
MSIRAWLQGFRDGWAESELSSGMTYNDPRRNEAYDAGVNVGQILRWGRVG